MIEISFTIITPTVQRQSLIKTCQSIDEQTLVGRWQHIVIIDCAEMNDELIFSLAHPNRLFLQCEKPHRNGGNSCRHDAWDHAANTYLWHVDDDNFVNGPRVLEEMASVIEDAGDAQWFLFPILRHGSRFYFDPPQPCYFDTGNAVVHNDFAQWPDIPDYASDAVWLQQFKNLPYKAFPDFPPIMVMPCTSFGAGGGINGQ